MNPPTPPPPPPRPFDAKRSVVDSWGILINNFGPLVGGHLVMMLIMFAATLACVFPVFVVTGPLMVGYARMCLRAVRGEAIELNDLFWAFQHRFMDSFILGLILSGLPSVVSSLLGAPLQLLLLPALSGDPTLLPILIAVIIPLIVFVMLLPVVIMVVLYTPSFFYFADGYGEAWPVMELSRKRVMANQGSWISFWAWWVLPHLAGILTCGLGLLIVIPWNVVGIALAYERERSLTRHSDGAR